MSSYQVLARKWRPQNFADMIGQQHVLRALVNALDNQRIHHAYLFTGMRGVGKTTIARIFAKCLNCETKGVSSEPCGSCSACQDIDAGRFFDLIEVDAASRTKVDETRELLENVPYAPASGRYKVYLIDEVHMFSTHSFNALLKTLEEPPEHVKFLLATTDPQKVPVTVLSRCLQFNLKRMGSTGLADYLAQILDAEKMAHDRTALELIARAADGSVRDSLSLVEQAAAFGGGEVRATDVESMLGRVSTDRLVELIAAIDKADAAPLFERVDALAEYAPDYVQVMGELLSLLHRIAMLQSVPDANTDVNEPLKALASSISAEALQLYYQIGQHARRDMPHASDQREAFDMALLRMIAFAPQTGPLLAESAMVAPNNDSKAAAASNPTPASSSSAAVSTSAKPQANTAPVSSASVAPPTAAEAQQVDAAAGLKKNKTGRELAAEALAAANAPDPVSPNKASEIAASLAVTPSAQSEAALNKDDTQSASQAQSDNGNKAERTEASSDEQNATPADNAPNATAKPAVETLFQIQLESLNAESWPKAVDAMNLAGMPKQLASHTVFHTREGTRLNLQIETSQSHLVTPQFTARLQTVLSECTRSDVTVAIEQVEDELNTPARIEEKRQADALEAARQAIDSDPMVKRLLSSVDGVVDAKSVRPIDAQSEETE